MAGHRDGGEFRRGGRAVGPPAADPGGAVPGSLHGLPDLSPYRRSDMALIVRMMREGNGADQVIDDAEAVIITQYLENTK